MGAVSFFIEFVFSFPALSSSPQCICIDFSVCPFINVYKAFREPREEKVSKYLVEEELKTPGCYILADAGQYFMPCGVLLLGYGAAYVGMIKAGKILVQPIYSHCRASNIAGSRKT